MDKPGEVQHGIVKYCAPSISLEIETGYVPSDYRVWYYEALPFSQLGYGSNRPLWREGERNNYPWRSALYDDFKARGQINPLLVWNHTCNAYAPKPYEMYVKVGRNKCWAMRALGWTECKALVCGDAEPFPGGVEVGPVHILDYWHDGKLMFTRKGLQITGAIDAAKLCFPKLPGEYVE